MIKKISGVKCKKKRIALTFDDGPDGKYTAKILDILKHAGIKASFFLVGKNVKKYPSLAKRIRAEGHDIGNHTYTHPVSLFFTNGKSEKFIREEIEQTNHIIKEVVGEWPLLFRPPLARWDLSSRRFLSIARSFGHLPVGWSWSAIDWLGSSFVISQRLLRCPKNDGDIVLLHDGAEKAFIKRRQATVKMLPGIIEDCRRRCLEPVALTEALGLNEN
ncbi:MAG: polysaccharide deacetylase family protein [Candidatus Omnitrophota bacterium]